MLRRIAVALGSVVLAMVTHAGPAAAVSARVDAYRPPTTGVVVDPFRPPAFWFGPGNRGLEYATATGSPVLAIGDGRVAFAGPVAKRLVVVVNHPDGLRSSYVGVARITVVVGQRIHLGEQLAVASWRLHLGVRRGRNYLDPARLFEAAAPPHAILVGPYEPVRT